MKSFTDIKIGDKSLINDFDVFVFDLDDTLYPEIEYLKYAYAEIADYVSQKYQLNRDSINTFLIDTFLTEGRVKLFDKLIKTYFLDQDDVVSFLEILRNVSINNIIEPFPLIIDLLRTLKERNKLVFILTNGNPVQQKNKIESINWHDLNSFFTPIYANLLAPKPSPIGLFEILKLSSAVSEKIIFIGDSEVDRLSAYNAQMAFLDVNRMMQFLEK
ncbi:HAD family hydrolase [Solitalea longa]|nr:HAD family hydrolase [Solitalea longa]